ncbi:MAG TPA: PAS domain S-box protein [Anaerolineaceae bacterium]|nr:PAS domain S-box protein [Anaerolineaceae bacterium]
MTERYRILILDDDQHLGELLQIYLETATSSRAEWVDTVPVFWERVRSNPYDIIFLDYKLPGITGLEVIAELALQGIRTPVVMMTGAGNEQIAVQAIQAGAVDYLVKGHFDLSALPNLIHKAVQMHALQMAVERTQDENRYQILLLNNIREAVVVWNLEGEITFWNPAAYLLFGWPATERVGQSVYDTYLSSFTPPVIIPGEENTAGFEIERQYRTKKGEIIWISSRTTALRDASGERKIIGYMDVSRNITRSKQEQQALKESQHFVQRIVDTTPNVLYIYDLIENRYTYANKVTADVLGYALDTLFAMEEPLRQVLHPDDYPMVLESYQHFAELGDGKVLDLEYRVKTSGGDNWHWLHSRDTIFQRLPDGSPRQVIGIAEDITARKQAEDALRRRLEIEQLIASISTNLINLMSGEMDLGINDGLEAVSEFTGVDHSYVVLFNQATLTAAITNSWSNLPTSNPFPDGQRLPLSLLAWILKKFARFENVHLPRISDLPYEAGALQQWLQSHGIRSAIWIPMHYKGILQGMLGFDTSAQEKHWEEEDIRMLRTIGDIFINALVHKWAEEALQESEARYRAIVDDHQTDFICRFLPDGSLTFVNEAYCRYYGKTREELVGRNLLDFIPEEDRSPVYEQFSRLTPDHPVETYEHRIYSANKQVRWFERTDRAIFDELNRFSEIQSIGRDITDRKEMQAQIREAQNQLAQQSRLAAIGGLAASVAHLINNPLTTIIGEAQILGQDADDPAAVRESVAAIERAGWRAQKVVEQLVKFSQPNAGSLEKLSINATLERAIELVSARIEEAGIQLARETQTDLPAVRGNARQFEDLWVNLFLYACDYAANGQARSVQVKTHALPKNAVAVELGIEGLSLPDEEIEKIFEPGLLPQAGQHSSGMELSICREIVRQHHGAIQALRSPVGTTFHIEFPGEV